MSEQTYLSVGQTAKRTGVATSTLRFYESRGLIESVRTAGNQRRFDRSTLRRISVIRIAQTLGLTLEEIASALDRLPQGRTPTQRDWEKLSTHWRKELDNRIELLQQTRDKLSACIGCGCLSLKRCALYNAKDKAARHGPGPRYLMGDTPSGGD